MNAYQSILPLVMLITISANVTAFERESLIKSGEITHGGFGGFGTKTGSINGHTQTMTGGRGAWLINHNLYLGGAGYGTEKNIHNTDLAMGYGGLLVGYIINPKKLIHYNMDVIVGAGSLGDRRGHGDYDNHDHNQDTFAVIEPSFNVGFAITKYADASIGVSYRYVQETNQINLSDSDLSGWSVNTNLVFGKF